MRAAERVGNRTGKVKACLALTFASEARTWAFAVLHRLSQHFQSIILRLLWACKHFHDWIETCTMQSCLFSHRNGPEVEEDGGTRSSGLGQGTALQPQSAGVGLQILYCEGSATLATMKRWNQHRVELHAPPHIPRRPTSWERLVYAVSIGQSNGLDCQRTASGHVMMMGSRTAPSSPAGNLSAYLVPVALRDWPKVVND